MSDRPIADVDLNAYIDGQLDPSRRIAVQAYLSRNPAVAANVMADLRRRDELRMALSDESVEVAEASVTAATRLSHALWQDGPARRLRRVAAVAMLVAVGWTANEVMGPIGVGEVVASAQAPDYVDEALRAHRTSLIRAGMTSQPEVTDLNAEELRAATAIVMPDLPQRWELQDVQVYPSPYGPSIEVAMASREFGQMSLFAVRPGGFDVVEPTLTPLEEFSAVYFQVGEVAYVLVASGDAKALDRAATDLASTLY